MFNDTALAKAMKREDDVWYINDGGMFYICSGHWIARLDNPLKKYPKTMAALWSRFGFVYTEDGCWHSRVKQDPVREDNMTEKFKDFLRQYFPAAVYDTRLSFTDNHGRDLRIFEVRDNTACYSALNSLYRNCIREYDSANTLRVAGNCPLLFTREDELFYVLPVHTDFPPYLAPL